MKRMLTPVVLAVLAAVAPLTTPEAGAGTDVYYVALGDSYSSGEGVEPYDPDSLDCHRSAGAYPSLAAPMPRATRPWPASWWISSSADRLQIVLGLPNLYA
jgi:hypothetical protein